jgi:hypothetical protein
VLLDHDKTDDWTRRRRQRDLADRGERDLRNGKGRSDIEASLKLQESQADTLASEFTVCVRDFDQYLTNLDALIVLRDRQLQYIWPSTDALHCSRASRVSDPRLDESPRHNMFGSSPTVRSIRP